MNILALIFILSSIGLFFGYVNPAYQKTTGAPEMDQKSVKELQAEVGRYEEALSKTREIELARTGLLEKYNSIAVEDREALLKLLPDHIDSVRLIIDINNIAAQYSMVLKNINLSETGGGTATERTLGPREEKFGKVELSFSVSGSYNDFRSFLGDLERSLRLLDVTSVTFAASEEDEYDYQIKVSTYRLK